MTALSETHHSEATEIFWRRRELDPAQLSHYSVRLEGLSRLDLDPLKVVLKDWGLLVCESGDADLVVVVVDSYRDARLRSLNQQYLATGQAWMLAKPVGLEAWIGPRFLPESACWECLYARLRLHDPLVAFLEEEVGVTSPALSPLAYTPATLTIAYHRLAAEVVAILLGDALLGYLLTFHLTDWRTESHPVTRLPTCPVCGNPPVTHARNLPSGDAPDLDLTHNFCTL